MSDFERNTCCVKAHKHGRACWFDLTSTLDIRPIGRTTATLRCYESQRAGFFSVIRLLSKALRWMSSLFLFFVSQKLKSLVDALDHVCAEVKRVNQSMFASSSFFFFFFFLFDWSSDLIIESSEEADNLFSCLDKVGHAIAAEEPLLGASSSLLFSSVVLRTDKWLCYQTGSCFEIMSSFSKSVEESELNLVRVSGPFVSVCQCLWV